MPDPIKLTQWSTFSGCGAKMAPELLDKALCGLSQIKRPEVLADFSGSEDAGVYQINAETALVQTIDFFPPIVDEPGLFGEIAAANALSDIYAMGARPISAVNVLCYPEDELPMEYLKSIMEGALAKLNEAGTALLGGHSVKDKELKFGFSVNGLIHPDKIIRNNSPREGDVLILTKALGTGAINTALKAGMASEESIKGAKQSMRRLNLKASEAMQNYDISACTDITGFGLAGHASEMIATNSLDMHLSMKSIPGLPGVMDYIGMGLVPEGTYKNKKFRLPVIENPETVHPEDLDLIFDPQTSGGLLIAIQEKEARYYLDEMKAMHSEAYLIGKITKGKGRIILDA